MPSVRDIMDANLPTVRPDDSVETVVHLLRDHDLPGIAVVNDGGRCVGMVTESDLVIADEEGDLHLPHMISLFGGVVFLEPLSRFEHRLKKAVAAEVNDMMTADPITVEAGGGAPRAARPVSRKRPNPPPPAGPRRPVGEGP